MARDRKQTHKSVYNERYKNTKNVGFKNRIDT